MIRRKFFSSLFAVGVVGAMTVIAKITHKTFNTKNLGDGLNADMSNTLADGGTIILRDKHGKIKKALCLKQPRNVRS